MAHTSGKIERMLTHSNQVNIFVNEKNFVLSRETDFPNYNVFCGAAVAAAFNDKRVTIHHGDAEADGHKSFWRTSAVLDKL